jgi:hypothetical protein
MTMTLKGNIRITLDQDTGRWVAERSKFYLGGHSGMGVTELEALLDLLRAEGTIKVME